jgi:hypothetical protein
MTWRRDLGKGAQAAKEKASFCEQKEAKLLCWALGIVADAAHGPA